ncbi:MAG: hypothetical protein R3E91_04705 [Chlamydiales bacterium]
MLSILATITLSLKGVGTMGMIASSMGIVASELIIGLYLSCKKKTWHSPLLSKKTPTSFKDTIERLSQEKMHQEIHGVYVLSNESGIKNTIQFIEKEPPPPTNQLSCHVGLSGLHNFDIIAARRSHHAVIIDFNSFNKKFINECLKILNKSNTNEDFVKKICKHMELDPKRYNHYQGDSSPICRMKAEIDRPSSWLWKEDQTGKFEYIKTLAREEKIVPITGDFRQLETCKDLVKNLNKFNCPIDTLYLSNLHSYLSNDEFDTMLAILRSSVPLVIHCTPPKECTCKHGCQCAKVQHIYR